MQPKIRRNISVRELASRLGISTATVSRALNNQSDVSAETRARVLELADQVGYMPRVGQRFQNVIGLVYPNSPVRPDYGSFESAMLAGVMRGVNEHRFDLTMIDIERDIAPEESYTQFFRRKGVRGVLVRNIRPTTELAEKIAAEGFPCVMVADRTDDAKVQFICSDSDQDSIRAVEHFVQLGHQKIALVIHTAMDSDHQDRLQGYMNGLEQNGIEVDESLIIREPASMEGGGRALDRLLSLPEPPTAIYVTNPLTTVGMLHRCLELKLHVPDELSIIGFDDSDVRYRTFPRYTAVCQDAEQFGYEATQWLTRTLEGVESKAFRVHRPTTMSFNQSTGPAPLERIRLAPNRSEILREPMDRAPAAGVAAS